VCGRTFVNTNQTHTCAPPGDLDRHFTGREPQVRAAFDRVLAEVLARRFDSARFRRVEVFSPRNVVHAFRLAGPHEVDAEFVGWLAEAYQVGLQHHLIRMGKDGRHGQAKR
jgi:hypothetical protein